MLSKRIVRPHLFGAHHQTCGSDWAALARTTAQGHRPLLGRQLGRCTCSPTPLRRNDPAIFDVYIASEYTDGSSSSCASRASIATTADLQMIIIIIMVLLYLTEEATTIRNEGGYSKQMWQDQTSAQSGNSTKGWCTRGLIGMCNLIEDDRVCHRN